MTSQERVKLILAHKEPDHVPLYDGIWGTTVTRWRGEGLPKDTSPAEYFDYDLVNIGFDQTLRLEKEIKEETDEYIIFRNESGSLRRQWKNRASVPEFIDFLIKDRATWDAYKERFKPDESRVNWENSRKTYEEARKKGKFVAMGGSFGFQLIFSNMVGPERTMLAMAEEPDWAKEMFDAVADMTIAMGEIMLDGGFEFDAAHPADDLGYRNGTFFSPKMYRELIFPAHKRICDFFRARSVPVMLHSCGNVNEIVPDLIEAGISALNPLEVKAGMDLIELKKKYGDVITLIGGIDVRTWATGDLKLIEDEIKQKVTFAKEGGGYIFHSDHSIPDNVSFQTYQKVVEFARRYGAY